MLFKTDAVVLRKNKISDSDVILTLFTRKSGKVKAVAKGGRKPKSKLSPASHPFIFGEFIINKGSKLDRISSVDIKESFYKVREDLIRLAYASYIAELCESVILEGVTNNRLFDTLLKSLYLITYDNNNLEFIKATFQIKLLDYVGFRPEVNRCVSCGNESFEKYRFSIQHGGLICDLCSNQYEKLIVISNTVKKLIDYILRTDIITLSKLKLNQNIVKNLNKLFDKYIEIHLEKNNFKSLEFLKTLNKI
ncbi:DNA replication and repair protein RecO [Caminicella sporogenes DSM 14501]|uniref:DNA repair protein RecO n=1 Tax=Caminicella sporogenes DSM 14501 TaxID=1121266 RepID=A0A1M6MB63_9FIRM|nr:DNA repair protein RecO [Caminicella sporogenes]RKD27623.1 DNA repair protein RecO [Caminicella sporogenes]WIF94789.1 DNA repair protein RecO [Caminicella sporogenes]SHJ80654.1 DNA replication and repair protein RecO [Caminicella sporogenes DSM 14501]